MKRKDIELRIPAFHIFGEYTSGEVDISEGDNIDFLKFIPIKEAEKLIADREKVINLLLELSEKIGSDFDKAWYELK